MNPVNATSAISQIGQLQNLNRLGSGDASSGLSQPSSTVGFGDLVNQFIEQTNVAQTQSDTAIQDFVTGKSDNVQQVVMAMANADMSFQLFMEIRNHLIDSYNELMRMQF